MQNLNVKKKVFLQKYICTYNLQLPQAQEIS